MILRSSQPIALNYNADVISSDKNSRDGDLVSGYTIPAEMLSSEIVSEGIHFKMGSCADGQKNAVDCNGQTISLPKGKFNRLYILASATQETQGLFRIGKNETTLTVQPWTGFVGQYDNRVWDTQFAKIEFKCDANVVAHQNRLYQTG